MKILIDAFGGDHSPEEVIAGAAEAVGKKTGFTAVLVGKREVIEKNLKNFDYDEKRIEIIDAEDVITCEEEPTVAVRHKPNSSVCVAFKALKEDEEAGAFVSAGSTGAVLVGATLKLGRISGISRPALCPILPTVNDGKVLLLDSGANADCKPINLWQFAIMGSAFAELNGIKDPKVALLSNGAEDEKGNMLNHEAFPVLKRMKSINFVGNVEARDILSGEYDVIVSDGFSGNVALKSMEGAVETVMRSLKSGIYGSAKGKFGALFLKKTLKETMTKLDYTKRGGALFLGVKKPVIKVHGSSLRGTFASAILQAADSASLSISGRISEKLALDEGLFGGE